MRRARRDGQTELAPRADSRPVFATHRFLFDSIMKLLVAATAAVALLAACAGPLEPLDLAITFTATPTTAAVGDTITLVSEMQGNNMIAIDAAFGDGSTDGSLLPYARTARNTFKHVYAAAGTYTASARVVQADSASKSATVTVTIH
jgi:hypothetical protein